MASSGAFSGGNVYVGGTATIYGGQIDGGSITNSGTGESAGNNIYAVTAYNSYGGTGSVD